MPEMWGLQSLSVHVDYQRRGFESMLIAWGKKKAEKEGVCHSDWIHALLLGRPM